MLLPLLGTVRLVLREVSTRNADALFRIFGDSE